MKEMGKGFKYCIAALFIMVCTSVSGQFSLSDVGEETTGTRTIFDSVRLDRNATLTNDYYRDARARMERRARRKERNTTELNATLQLSQVQFENWASGGDNTFSGLSTLYFRHAYKSEKFSAEIKFDARYGLNYIEKRQFKNEDAFKINFLSNWNINQRWSYAAAAELRSQFATGYKSREDLTRKSTFMAPGYLTVSVGFQYTNNKGFTAILSPVAGSATFMLDEELQQQGLNGLKPGEKEKWQIGPMVDFRYDKEFHKKVFRYRSSLKSFTNLSSAPTVRWENWFDIKATKFLTTSLYWLAAYDKMASTPKPDAMQYQYSIGVGLAYTFKNK